MTVKTIRGRTINLKGEDYVLPPLNLENLRNLEADINRLAADSENPAKGIERFEIMSRVVATALRRNYANISDIDILTMLDLGNVVEAYNTALAASGFEPVGEATPAVTN